MKSVPFRFSGNAFPPHNIAAMSAARPSFSRMKSRSRLSPGPLRSNWI